MSYIFHNLSDDKLEELSSAVHNERKRRFLLTVDKYPMLPAVADCNSADAIKAYRQTYGLALAHAYTLFNHYHRNN